MATSRMFKIFDQQIVPWVERDGISRIAVAQSSWSAWQEAQRNGPHDIEGVAAPLRGRRQAVKGRRSFGNATMVDACWPDDGLNSIRTPNLAFVLSGAVLFPLGGYQLRCRPGHGVLVPAGVAKSDGTHLCLDDSVRDNHACEILSICPFNGAIVCWLSYTHNGKHWSAHSPEERCYISNSQGAYYLEAFSAEILKREVRYRNICEGLLITLVNIMWRELRESAQLLPMSVPQSGLPAIPQADQEPIARAREYIHTHLSESLSLDEVARHAYMSRRLFTKHFLQKTGRTFQEYLNDCRFEKACRLLVQTDWSIVTIGRFIGLKPTRLRELIRQRTGVSPGEFRRNKENA